MQYLVTTSGYTIVPPSGLTIVLKSLQLDTIVNAGSIRISGSLGTFNDVLTAISPVVMDLPFLQRENVSITPVSGTAIVNYIYAGEPEAFKYAYGVSWYSQTPPNENYHKRWVGSTSGTYQPISGGFGG
jgi:hypothetical protein